MADVNHDEKIGSTTKATDDKLNEAVEGKQIDRK